MSSPGSSDGTPGGTRPRTRRSGRTATSAAVLRPARLSAPGTAGPATSAASRSAGRQAPAQPVTVNLFPGITNSRDVLLPLEQYPPVRTRRRPRTTHDEGSSDSEPRNEEKEPTESQGEDQKVEEEAPESKGDDEKVDEKVEEQKEDKPDCGICLETCLHPVKLPCGHVFCYLCVKGAAKQSARCAYCRAEVTEKYINNPHLLDEAEVERELTDTTQSHHWLYQGRNGWWRYDERTSRDIEEAYAAQQASVQISVAGELYTVEFSSLTQFNDECHGRRRRVRREASDAPPDPALRCKGVAGLRKKRRRQ